MSFSKQHHRAGLTIVELLVVLGVLAVLLGIAATAVKTGTRGKKQREAARQVNAFIAGAQARALEINRPVGVEIVRDVRDTDGTPGLSAADSGISNTSLVMYVIETPPTYAGDDSSATATLTAVTGSNVTFTATFPSATASMIGVEGFVRPGDLIRFGYRGDKYRIIGVDTTTRVLTVSWEQGQSPPTHAAGSYPFQIYPQPIRSSVTPLQLPTDMCIDLTCSGFGNSGGQFATWNSGSHEPIRFTFNPRGDLDRVWTSASAWQRASGNIHLLVGKYDFAVNALEALNNDGTNDGITDIANTSVDYELFLTDPEFPTNLGDGTAMWVSVNFLTGQVTTTRNKLIPPTYSFLSTQPAKNRDVLATAREYATKVLTVQGEGDQ